MFKSRQPTCVFNCDRTNWFFNFIHWNCWVCSEKGDKMVQNFQLKIKTSLNQMNLLKKQPQFHSQKVFKTLGTKWMKTNIGYLATWMAAHYRQNKELFANFATKKPVQFAKKKIEDGRGRTKRRRRPSENCQCIACSWTHWCASPQFSLHFELMIFDMLIVQKTQNWYNIFTHLNSYLVFQSYLRFASQIH